MFRQEFAKFLRVLADMVESGDSAEGNVGYLIADDPFHVNVSGAIRTGNLEGQGGVVIL